MFFLNFQSLQQVLILTRMGIPTFQSPIKTRISCNFKTRMWQKGSNQDLRNNCECASLHSAALHVDSVLPGRR